MKNCAKKLICLAAIAVGVVFSLALAGCSGKPVGVCFSLDEISIYVGETRDIYPYIGFTPALAENRSFTLSADGDCIKVDGGSIAGVSTGSCTLTATAAGGCDSITVNVAYRPANRVSISADGDLIQNVSTLAETESIVFGATVDDFTDPSAGVVWYVNGVKVGEGARYELVPSYLGEYVISCKTGDATAEQSVKIYRKTDAFGEYGGELEQSGNYTPVRFIARETVDSRNPRSVFEWTVNGTPQSDKAVFEFVPPARGDYAVELSVNGVKRDIAGKSAVTVRATDDRAPSGQIELSADGVRIVWDDGMPASSVQITSPDGRRSSYYRTDAAYSSRFLQGAFDADGLIEPCSDDPSEYTVRVFGAVGGEPFTFAQYPKTAEAHIKERVLCGNSFIDGEDKAAAWLDELYACETVEATGYLARGVDVSAVTAAMENRAALLGISMTAEIRDSEIDVRLSGFGATEAPGAATAEQSRGALPHIELDQNNIRSVSSYVMHSDRKKIEIEAINTEQLLRIVSAGYKPAPRSGSPAATAYTRARAALISMIGRDYGDYEKLHAIHDWLQFTTVRTSGWSASAADRLESVFGGYGIVSSAGISKAFALMCGMEGIECTVETVDFGGKPYYYNKVKFDGLWYVVDAYGGETGYSDGSPAKKYELVSHERFLISDGKASALGLTASGEEALDDISVQRVKHARDGVFFDGYVDRREYADKSVIGAAVAYAFESAVLGDAQILVIAGDQGVSRLFFSNSNVDIELETDGGLSAAQRRELEALCDEAIEKYCADNAIKLIEKGITHRSDGNILHITVALNNR